MRIGLGGVLIDKLIEELSQRKGVKKVTINSDDQLVITISGKAATVLIIEE